MTRDPDFAAMVAGVPDLQWTPPERVAALVARVAAERPPALHGRFVHAEDDLDELLERLAEADGDARGCACSRCAPTRCSTDTA
jgi:hypothetical protein